MKDTFLFDIDGTLLQAHMDEFVKIYLVNVMEYFADLIPKEQLMEYMNKSIYYMMNDQDTSKTNYEVFFNKFLSLCDVDADTCSKRFDDFYDDVFYGLKPENIKPNPELVESVQILKQKGYKLCIASNPGFPLKAQVFRANWAGFIEEDFDFITSIENMSSCKPYVSYYEELLTKINKPAENCYMIGNDVVDDLPAKKAGIEVILLEEFLSNAKNEEITCKTMTTKGFLAFVKTLGSVC